MAKAKSDTEHDLQLEIAKYLQGLRKAGWTQAQIGTAGGFSDHTAVSKALKLTHTMGVDALVAIEAALEAPWPQSLREAIIAYRRPPLSSQPIPSKLERARRAIEQLSGDEVEELVEERLRQA